MSTCVTLSDMVSESEDQDDPSVLEEACAVYRLDQPMLFKMCEIGDYAVVAFALLPKVSFSAPLRVCEQWDEVKAHLQVADDVRDLIIGLAAAHPAAMVEVVSAVWQYQTERNQLRGLSQSAVDHVNEEIGGTLGEWAEGETVEEGEQYEEY